jgi:hypothetical protein
LVMNNIIWNKGTDSTGSEIYIKPIESSPYGKWPNQYGGIEAIYSDIQGGWEGEGNIDAYPSFVDTSINDFSLLDSSRCVGNGIDSIKVKDHWYTFPNNDFYGNSRPHPIDEFVDMGAIESPYERVVIGIDDFSKIIPSVYELSQNYPNPFNPTTNIEFTLSKSEFVELKVFNILGKEISTLVSKKLNQGNHTYTFDGQNLASGIYYYQLVAGEYREVKKMILLR